MIVWSVATATSLRVFPGPKEITQMAWPLFRWSHDDKYLARLGDDCIHVYEAESMKLLKDRQDKRTSLKVDGVVDFAWSPATNLICYWVPEAENLAVRARGWSGRARSARARPPALTRATRRPARRDRALRAAARRAQARVTVLELPSRVEQRQKNLFNLQECKLHWHPQGDFLAVKVDRHTKTKKTIYTTFELFRMRDRNVAMEVLELEPKETRIRAFAWEPKGVKFALISGDGPKFDVHIYTMESVKGTSKLRPLVKLDKRAVNSLHWSPLGSTLLMAGMTPLSGDLEWYDTNALQVMGADEHFMLTDVAWDPTGRFVTTGVSHWRHQSDNGYNVWSSQGKLLGRHLKDKFYQLTWRPRPPILLSDEQEKEVRKNIREYSKCVARARAPARAHRRRAPSRAHADAAARAPPPPRARAGASRRRTSRSSTPRRSPSSSSARR